MNKDKYVFAQLVEFLGNNKFRHLVDKYDHAVLMTVPVDVGCPSDEEHRRHSTGIMRQGFEGKCF